MSKRSALERFEEKYTPEPNSGCWLWLAFVNPLGYGMFRIKHGVSMSLAHRVAYELFCGPIPRGLTVDHLCRVRCCVNPRHLEAVTHRENTSRCPRKTHCPHGHAYTFENTRYKPAKGKLVRRCRACGRAERRRISK